ncbi:uncharacterized protein V1516DRAFT_678706 [Lipomyces oligophaga]|uniref:uncharacterized protein n=1 Tax=Lipomyces oligophaga TaxID=45792 RepID=UPI0034CD9173
MPPKNRRAYLNALYSKPLPVAVIELPALIPYNPICIAQYAYAFLAVPLIKQFFTRRKRITAYLSTSEDKFNSYVSAVYVDDIEGMRQLWSSGFFGKGTQSRSEPTWEIRTAKRLGLAASDGKVAPELVTAQRRDARRKFKQARELAENGITEVSPAAGSIIEIDSKVKIRQEDEKLRTLDGTVKRLEKLHLTPQEAFFLTFGLDTLDIYSAETGDHIPIPYLLTMLMPDVRPDNDFIMHYVVYHYYRSHGWCVRDGVKFGVDYLLYCKGPPFSHADFAVIIMPLYADENRNQANRREWNWISGVNRVVSGVKKTLILCYVQVPESIIEWRSVDELLSRYMVKEISIRRWIPSRTRD